MAIITASCTFAILRRGKWSCCVAAAAAMKGPIAHGYNYECIMRALREDESTA